jgi:F-type H+-transporting ATPase subunit gamma
MRRAIDLAVEEASMGTLVEITSVFEGIASMRIAQIKDEVINSTNFFDQLWGLYSQVRVRDTFMFGRKDETDTKVSPKRLMIVITAEGGFSGDIDQKLIKMLLEDYKEAEDDIIVIGRHGATQLNQVNVKFEKYYKLPTRDTHINVEPILRYIQSYKTTTVYYQQYVSLMKQDVKRIDLSKAIREKGLGGETNEDVISEATYIFEPSTYDVVAHLESSMMRITVNQLIMESKLAQYASRFKAMSRAHDRADEIKDDLHLNFNRARRAVKDERLKEIINSMKKSQAAVGAK